MSVLLNITMPKTCEVCPCNDDNWRCGATGEYFDYDDMYERRRDDCPLVEIPTPHGRLGDLDTLQKQVENTIQDAHMSLLWKQGMMYAHGLVEASKTVIETEGETDA